MTSSIKVSQIMTKGVIVGNVKNSFTQIMKFFTEYGIQHLPIEENGVLVGIISVNDMSAFIFSQATKGNNLHATALDALFSVSKVMTHDPITITPEDTVAKVVEILADGRFQALPVTTNGEIQGIVTNKDLVRMLRWEYTH
jgi:CBS domain-containing protein